MKRNWEILDLSVVRNPVLSLDYSYQNILNQNQADKLVELALSNEIIKESIYFANEKFMLELIQYDLKSEKKKRKIQHTLLKYLSRMTSKAAPFGLFSSISEVEFTNNIVEELKENEYSKQISVDLQWLNGIITKLEQDTSIFEHLELKFNDLNLKEGERRYFTYRSQYGQEDTFKKSFMEKNGFLFSIKSSKLLDIIEHNSSRKILSEDLIKLIKSVYPDLELKDIVTYLKKLVEIEVLTTNLRPDLRSKNHLERILSFFEKRNLTSHTTYLNLREISNLIEQYRELNFPHEKSIRFYDEIKKRMMELNNASNVIQVDLKSSNKKISSKVKTDLEKSMQIIKLFSVPIYGASDLSSYINAFIKKYGFYNEVSLIDLLYSNDFGSPKNYNFPKGNIDGNLEINIEDNKKYKSILALVQKSALQNKEEIFLDKKTIHNLNLEDDIQQSEFVESFDMLFSLVRDGEDNYLTFNNEVITKNGGQLIGRFSYLLSEKVNDELVKLNEFEKSLYGENYELAEITCQGLYGRSANISTSSKMRDFIIPIMNSNDNDDIEVKLSSLNCYVNSKGSFVLLNKETNKIVKVKISSMLHGLFNYPNIYRFLIAIEGQNKYHMSSIFPLIQKKLRLPYLPRVRFKNLILHKRTWTIDLDILGVIKGDGHQEIINKVDLWRKEFHVPNIVEMKENDSTLIINLGNDLFKSLLIKEIMKKAEVTIVELDFGLNESYLSREKNVYKSEISVSTLNLSSKIEEEKFLDESSNNSIVLPPGNEYIYYKIYIRPDYQNEFLYKYIYPFLSDLQKEGIVNDYFFIRYIDKYYHIRLRIRFTQNNGHIVFQRITDFMNLFVKSRLISNISINTYFPETHRYGGENLLPHIHNYFYADSKLVLELLKLMNTHHIKLETVIHHTINEILDSFEIKGNYKIGFLERYLSLYGNSRNRTTSKISFDDPSVNFKVRKLVEIVSLNLSTLNEVFINNSFSDSRKEGIIFSIIHMHINRIMETIDRDRELQLVDSILSKFKENEII